MDWGPVITAFIANLPSTLTAIGALIVIWRSTAKTEKAQAEQKTDMALLVKSVDGMQDKVDGARDAATAAKVAAATLLGQQKEREQADARAAASAGLPVVSKAIDPTEIADAVADRVNPSVKLEIKHGAEAAKAAIEKAAEVAVEKLQKGKE